MYANKEFGKERPICGEGNGEEGWRARNLLGGGNGLGQSNRN